MRFVRALLFLTVSVAIGIVSGCGRSNIDDYAPITDGGGNKDGDAVGPDGGPTCGLATCPNGCCDANGTCRAGTDVVACGGGGMACVDCVQQGFMLCDAEKKACGTIVQTCDANNCSSGCCTTFSGMQVCLSGQSSLACGSGGKMCADCTQTGQVCDGTTKSCTSVPCGPNTCAGCCNGNSCVSGVQDTTCGMGGVACTNCTANMQFCNTGKCQSQPPMCNAQTCPNGCCANGMCVSGTTDMQCGKGGQACTNCASMSEVCTGQACTVPPCNMGNCTGCCLMGSCLGGFANNHCGSGGANCVDCTQMGSTCDTLANPRVCQNMQMTCPSPYSMCPNNVTTPVLSVQKGVCSTLDLQDARAACLQGWGTLTCNQFFQFIQQQKPACGKCLAPFDYNFQDLTGIFNCTSPCNSASCNHSTGCVADCSTQSCSQCPNPQATSQCQTSVKQPNGQCFSYVQASQCVAQSLFGACSFCNPGNYFGNYGNWLQGVGQHFCGP